MRVRELRAPSWLPLHIVSWCLTLPHTRLSHARKKQGKRGPHSDVECAQFIADRVNEGHPRAQRHANPEAKAPAAHAARSGRSTVAPGSQLLRHDSSRCCLPQREAREEVHAHSVRPAARLRSGRSGLRATFDDETRQQLGPLGHVFTHGQQVISHSGPAEIARCTEDGGLVVIYRNGDTLIERTYSSCVGKQAGNVCLQHLPPSGARLVGYQKRRGVGRNQDEQSHIHIAEVCPTSPHKRGVMRRPTLRPCTFEEKPAVILSDVH